MQVQLSGDTADFIRRQLALGVFTTADEAVAEAIKFYEENEPSLRDLCAKIQEGLQDESAGRVAPFDIEDTKRRGRDRLSNESSRE